MLADYWLGRITLRKLRVLVQGLPQYGAHTRKHTDGRDWSIEADMAWLVAWRVMENTVLTAKLFGDKQAKLPADTRPQFPWTKTGPQTTFGDLGDNSAEDVIAFLDNL